VGIMFEFIVIKFSTITLFLNHVINFEFLRSDNMTMDVRNAVWFGFKPKSRPNYKINKHAVWFG
jgi:hypothetical protein